MNLKNAQQLKEQEEIFFKFRSQMNIEQFKNRVIIIHEDKLNDLRYLIKIWYLIRFYDQKKDPYASN